MKLMEAAAAYRALRELEHCKMPWAAALILYRAQEQLAGEAAFFARMERELAEKYAEDGIGPDGSFRLRDGQATDYFREHSELCALEVPMQRERLPALPETVSPQQLAALAPLFDFPGDDQEKEEEQA